MELSIAQLTELISAEVATGLRAAAIDEGAVRVDRAVVRVGTRASPRTDWQTEFLVSLDSAGTASAAPSSFIVREIARLPVSALQGVSSAWTKRLAQSGATSVGELAGLGLPELETCAHRYGRSAYVFGARARSCAVRPLPVRSSAVDRLTLGTILRFSFGALAADLDDDRAAAAVIGVAIHLSASLDLDVLDHLPLRVIVADA